MELRVHPAARREVNDAFDRCQAKFGKRMAQRFQTSVERAGQTLLRELGLGTPAANGVRMLPLRGLPHTFVYRWEGTVIYVIALTHQSRQPRYWTGRLPD